METIVAQATPVGSAGIGIVRVSGPAVKEIALRVLRRALHPREAYYGPFYGGQGGVLDYGIAIYFPAPYSFTGEEVLELQGHGGQLVLETLLEDLLAYSPVRLAEPGEFSKRAFLNGKLDLVQAEAVADLIQASSLGAVKGALRSLQGDFSAYIHQLAELMLNLRAQVEANLDFTEEEEIIRLEFDLGKGVGALLEKIEQVIETAQRGIVMREGMNLVIVGPTNAGKSSLFNYLCGQERAIVTDIPGTTRDVLRAEIAWHHSAIQLSDTAGFREAEDLVEREGIKRAYEEIAQADGILYVSDVSLASSTQLENEFLAKFAPKTKIAILHNKIDLITEMPRLVYDGKVAHLYLSVTERVGLEELHDLIKEWKKLSLGGEGCSARQRHLTALLQVKKILGSLQPLKLPLSWELVAEELRLAHQALMTITGEVVVDDLLERIFSEFCIGK